MPRTITTDTTATAITEGGEVDAYSIAEFCRRHAISPQFFHTLRKQGLGPQVLRVGRRVLVSKEAAAAWRAEREKAAQAAA
jgi:hypothetical protein